MLVDIAMRGSRTKGSLPASSFSELSMVAELLEKLLLVVILSFLSGGFVISGSSSTLILLEETMLGPKGLQPSTFEGGLDDLESFQAWAEELEHT